MRVTQRSRSANNENPSLRLPMPMTDGCASAWKILSTRMSLALTWRSLQGTRLCFKQSLRDFSWTRRDDVAAEKNVLAGLQGSVLDDCTTYGCPLCAVIERCHTSVCAKASLLPGAPGRPNLSQRLPAASGTSVRSLDVCFLAQSSTPRHSRSLMNHASRNMGGPHLDQ